MKRVGTQIISKTKEGGRYAAIVRFSRAALFFACAFAIAVSLLWAFVPGDAFAAESSLSLRARIERGSFAAAVAGIFDSISNFFRRFATERSQEEATIDGQAIREKNRAAALLFAGADTLVDVNAESTFKGEARFNEEVTMDALMRGVEIDLGEGTITASNIVYEVLPGDGILVSGDRQRPTISQLFWVQVGNKIQTRDPGLSLEIQGEL